MKKLFLCLTTAFFVLSSALLAQEAKNLIKNPNFLNLSSNDAKVPVGWYPLGGSKSLPDTCGVDLKEKPQGSKSNSYRVDGKHLILQWAGPIKPNTTYKLSCMMKTADMNWLSEARFQIIWLDKNKKELMTTFTNPDGSKTPGWNHSYVWTATTTDWKKFEIPPFTSPEDAKFALIRFGKSGRDAAGTAWFTDFTMVEAPAADPFIGRVVSIPYGKSFQDAVALSDFMVPPTAALAQQQTKVQCYYDNEAIYVKMTATQASIGGEQFMAELKNNTKDSLELFLMPDEKSGIQYHAILNPNGNFFTQVENWEKLKAWNFPEGKREWKEKTQIQHSVEVNENNWVANFRVPFSAMGLKEMPKAGTTWRVNFCRILGSHGSELSAWNKLTAAAFQMCDCFGKMTFQKESLIVSLPKLNAKNATIQVKNPTDKARAITINRVKHAGGNSATGASKTVEIPAKSEQQVELTAAAETSDLLWMEVREGAQLVAKQCALPSSTYIALNFRDPENVRTQTVYLANDMPFFIAWCMSHNLPSKVQHSIINRYQKAVDCVLEVPEGVTFTGMIHDASAYRWTQSPRVLPAVTPVTVDGKKYNQYRFELPLIANWGEPQFLFFYECSLPAGEEFKGRLFFILDGKPISETTKSFKTISVGKVKHTFKHLPFNIGLMDAVTLYNWFPKDTLRHYTSLGFNCISVPVRPMKSKEFYKGNAPKDVEDYYDLMYQEFLKADFPMFMNTVSISTGPEEHAWTRAGVPETVGIKRDGTKCTRGGYANAPALCFSYRGPKHAEWIKRLVTSSAFAKYRLTWLSLDMEVWRDPAWDEICYCPRCLKLYKEYCVAKNRPDMEKLDPRTADSPEFKKFWASFQGYCAAGFVTTAVDAVRETVKGAKTTSPWGEFTSQDYGTPGNPNDGGVASEQSKLNFYEMSVYHRAEGNYRRILHVRKDVVGMNSGNLATGLSFGQTGGCPDNDFTPDDCRKSIYEVMIFGTKNVVYYYDLYAEPLRISKMVVALNAVVPFEEIILNGKIVDDATSSTQDLILTHRTLGNESLLAVRAYYAKDDVTGTVRFKNVSVPMNVYDCETCEKIGSVTPDNPAFECKITKGDCRLLYIGTEKQWKSRK